MPAAQGPAPAAVADPRTVVTPLNADAIEDALRSSGILHKWLAVVDGLRTGFDVGASASIPQTVVHPNHSSASLVSICGTGINAVF